MRLVYGQPVSGRQLIQLRLERNQPLGEATWALPRVEVPKAKSVRGHVAVAADAGFRLTAERTQGLTEIATAFFPRKVAGIQAAFPAQRPGLAGDACASNGCRRPCRRMRFTCSPSAKASPTAAA